MIVMKFGGTSLADSERIAAAAEIVRGRLERRPVVVVSAFAGVTDLLVRAVAEARDGSKDALEPILADLTRRHRWAVSGSVANSQRRHDLDLEIDAILDELRQLLRSVRVLGEGTPRATDAILAVGEILSSRIVTAAFVDRGLAARWVDAREVVVTDDRHGAAEPDVDEIGVRAARSVAPPARSGEVPVVGGFYGATRDGRTTTLGRGGSDTSAAVLGCALGAGEIEIWTDVDGIMTADPKRVPAARARSTVSFVEAAELAFFGAKVLHPASVAPAVRRLIPVRVLNASRPEAPGTVVVQEAPAGSPPLVSVASRGGVTFVRVASRTMRVDSGFLRGVLETLDGFGLGADLVASCETGASLALPTAGVTDDLARALGARGDVETVGERGIVCVVGHGLGRSPALRGAVLEALAAHAPEIVAMGGSAVSMAAVVRSAAIDETVRSLHHTFFEGDPES